MVRGLKTFIEKQIPEAREMISIDSAVDQWKSDNPDKQPILVIDFGGFYRSVCAKLDQAQFDVLYGKHDRLLKATESILQRFENMGVQLEFFSGGHIRYDKDIVILDKRRQEYLKNVDKILHMIKLGRSTEYIVNHLKEPMYNNTSYFVAAIMLAAEYGHIHRSYHNEHKRDIAAYASRNNAIAILSGASDFILINGQWSFWDIEKFDTVNFQIMQTDKIIVRDFLELTDNELPLVGVLTGNDYPYNVVFYFLKSLGDRKCSFINLSKFIISNFRNKTSMVPSEIVRILSSRNISTNTKIAEGLLKLFVNCTDPEADFDDELSIAAKQIKNSYVYEYLNDLVVPMQPLFLHRSAYSKFTAAALEIYRRQMGIVLQHKHTEQRRTIICYNDTVNDQTVRPVYPIIEVPPLLSLYQVPEDGTLLKTKLKLICWITSDKLEYTTIEKIPFEYFCAVLALMYLTENRFILTEEADCILYCLQQYHNDPESMNIVEYPDSIAERPFQIIFLYDNFHQYMLYSINTVGLTYLLVHNQLDGVYFHQQYENFIHRSESEREILMKTVKDYRIYVNK